MRAAEFCPHAFDCASQSSIVTEALAKAQAKLQDPSIAVIIEVTKDLITAFKVALPGCGAVAAEGTAYIA